MAKMRSRTEALVNAYLNNYQNANATTVSGGQSAQQSAQSRGSAIMNATDKTLPTLKDYSADVLNGIVKSADNAQSTAISNFKLAKKQIEAEQKAAEKAAKAAAKSSGKSGSKKSSKKSSSTSSSTDDTSGSNTSLDSLFGGAASTSGGTTGSTAGNKPKADSTEKGSEKTKKKSAQEKYLEAKKAGARTTAAKSYAEQNGTGRVSAAQPARSRATGRAGNIIGSTAAAAGQAQSAAETQAAKDKRNDYKSRQEDIAAALKKLQTDASYRTELARPGRKLTGAEIQAVKEYNQKPGNLYKQVQAGELSLDDYNKQGQELARMNQKASLGGLGQDMQAFTAGLMTSVPFVKQVDSAIKDYANKATNGQYEKALESGVVPDFLQALENSKEQNRIAAGAGTMAGKAAQYNLFNNLMAGTPLAETMGKVGGKVASAASKVPVLGQFATPAAGEALGRILTDQTADTALDTIPSLVNDLQTYNDQQNRMKNGEQVDDALTPGQIGLNTLGNVAQNFAFNAIPEVGGAVLSRIKGTAGDAAQDALKQADDAAQDVQKSVPARNIVQPEANGTTGLDAQLQQMNTPDAANRSALNTLDELRGQVDLNGAQEKEAEQLRRAVLQRQQEIGDEAKAALQNSDNLPIDAQAAKAYNEVNGGVVNDNLGAGVRADVPGIADSRASNELQPGNLGDGISGQAAEGGQNSTASVLGRGVQGNDAKSAAQVAEWAKSITGKGRQSVYTRRIENLYNQMQNGASREGMAEEAANIAAGLVKESDFAEPLDEVTSALREYMKRTPIRLDEKAAGDILYTSGLKNIQQYNFQNGTKFSLTDGIPYDTAMQELGEMGVGVNGSSVDDLLKAVDASNAKPLVDSDQAAAYSDYLRDRILDGPSDTQMGAEDFADWLDVQSFDRDAPDYVQRLLERDSLTAIDGAGDARYNVNNIGGAQNGTEINVGRSIEGTEPGGTGTGYPDAQGAWRNADGDQRVFRQPVNETTVGGATNEAVQGRNGNDRTGSEGILQGGSDGTPQSGQRFAVGAESGEYLPANRVLVAEHLNQRPSVYDDSTRAIAEQAGAGAFDFRNADDAPETFAQALATAKANNVNGAAVDGHTAEEIANIVNNGGKTFLTPDGTAGGAVEADGNLTCVFKDAANNRTPGAGSSIALAAVKDGATKGDCYGQALVNMYSKAGLEPVARIPYAYGYNDAMDAQVRKQIADGIISKEPDVYALKLRDGYDFEKAAAEFNTAHRYTQSELDALPVYDDYDEMLAYRDSLLKAPSADAGGADALRSAASPLNGSESVPKNAIGAEETQYNRAEVPNLDYANQRVMQGDMDAATAAELGIGQQTHTVYSRAEGRDTAAQDFDVLVQQTGSVTDAGRAVANELNQNIQDNHWDAADVYRGSYAVQQLQQRLSELPEGSAEADVVKAQIANINRAVSAGQSKAGQALVSGRYAQPDEYSGIRRFNQYTQESVDRFANTREGQRLQEVAQDVADNMNGPMDDEFTAFIHDQGIDTGDDVRDQLEYMADQIQRMGQTHHVNINEEQARAAAASLQAGGTVEDIYGAFARQSLGIGDLSQEDMDYAVDTFRRIADMPDSRERYDLEMSVYNRMANYMPARGFADRLNNIRYLCMLGNTRTHVRNMLGNVMMGTVVRAKDNVAGIMQLALPQSQRTKAIGTTLTADGRQMVNRARDYAENNMYTTLFQDGRWNMRTGLEAARNTYTTPVGRAIGRLSDINGNLLEAEDNYFLRSEFGNSMASFLRARGYDSSIFDATDDHSRTVLREAAAQALADAREATFHEDNFLSTAFRNFSNDTRRHGPAGQLAYAVTEGILPFKKTPINIAKNALEYNPIGGTVEAIYRGATGQGATRVMDAAAKGVTGTAILGAGYLLARNGLLTGGGSGDDRADAYGEMTGEQNYAVKIPGKGTYTLDWASPASVPLLIGAQIAKDQEDSGEFNLTQTLDQMRQITQPILDTTMLQGLNDTLNSVSYADSNDKLATLGTSALGSFANQFVPTALGQVARTVDNTRRSTYGGGDTKTERDVSYNINKMKNKIPGLSEQNEAYIDQWGREQKSLDGTDGSAGGYALRGIYNMLSPGYLRQENVTPVDEYLQGLYGSTNDSHVLPEKASSKITVDSENYYMTPEEKTEYAKTSGQTAYDIIDSLRQNDMFLKLPEDQQSELVQKAYSVAKTAGGVAAVGDGVSGTNSKEYQAYQQGGVPTLESYLLTKNATDIARDEKRESTGKDTAELNDVETWNTLYNQFGNDAIPQFVDTTDNDSAVRRIEQYAGDSGVSAYMRAYSAVASTLEAGKTPNKYYVGIGMQKYGLDDNDFAKAYLAAYSKTDKKGAEMYEKYGVDGLKGWVEFKAYADADGNGHLKKSEVTAQLNKMSLTQQLYDAYYKAAMGK